MSRTQLTTPHLFRRWPATVLLVLALFWAQLLGLAHGVLHVHGVHASHAGVTPGHHDHAHGAHGLLAHLLAPADEAGECRLYDQLGQEGPVAPSDLILPSVLPLLPAWVVLQALQPRSCVAFAARAPPASR